MIVMIKQISSDGEQTFIHRGLEKLARPAKVLGVTALSGLAGYATAKGFDAFVMPVEPSKVYEVVSTAGAALIGGFVAAEAIER